MSDDSLAMEKPNRVLWGLTATNVVIAILLVLLLYWLELALAVIAPEIRVWPVFVTLVVGICLSALTIRYARKISSRVQRIGSRAVNSCALLLHILVVALFLAVFVRSTGEEYVIPEGYQGDVYVLFEVPDGVPVESGYHKLTYRIPNDGILRTRSSMPGGWTRTVYFIQRNDGSMKRINHQWLTTIPPTAENLSNSKDFGIFFPRAGSAEDSDGCQVRFSEVYVGTTAYLLNGYKERDLYAYLRRFPLHCGSQNR